MADILWTNNHFWLACLDGGLVRYDIDGDSMQAFLPGKTAGFKPSAITKSIDGALSGYPDTSRNSRQRVIAVDAPNPSSVSPS